MVIRGGDCVERLHGIGSMVDLGGVRMRRLGIAGDSIGGIDRISLSVGAVDARCIRGGADVEA